MYVLAKVGRLMTKAELVHLEFPKAAGAGTQEGEGDERAVPVASH